MAKMTALQEHNLQRRKKKDNEIAKLRALNKELYEALKKALALLDKQREEYNAIPTILPHKPVGEGEIAKAARKAIAKYEAQE